MMFITSLLVFTFNSCTSEDYYEKESSRDKTIRLNNFKKTMQFAKKDFQTSRSTSRSVGVEPSEEELAEEYVQQISGDALLLIKAYGVTEQDLISQFGNLDPAKISMTAQIILLEEELIAQGKTLSIFAQEDFQLSSLSIFGVNSTYAGDGPTVGACVLEAIGVRVVVQALVGDLAALGTAGVLKIVGSVATKYAGVIGGAVMVYQFSDCMGWLKIDVIGAERGIKSFDDLVIISPVSGYFKHNPIYISKKDLNFKSLTDFYIDPSYMYPIYTAHTDGVITADADYEGDYTFTSNETILGSNLDGSTIMEIN